MALKITDYERIAVVHPTQLGQFECPRCKGVCNERSVECRSPPQKRREWDVVEDGLLYLHGYEQSPRLRPRQKRS